MDNSKEIIIPIIYPSAAQFWVEGSHIQYTYAFNLRDLTSLPADYQITSSDAERAADKLGLAKPISLLAPTVTTIHHGKNYASRYIKEPIPPGNFFRIPDTNIYVASPELAFLQAAASLKFIPLMRLGMSLCAKFYPKTDQKYGQMDRTIITTPQLIADLARVSTSKRGPKLALKAAKYITGNSGSPMESALAIIFRLPIIHGGYDLYGFEMNYPIPLTFQGQSLTGKPEIHGDIVWPKQKICIEYNSKAAHNNDESFYKDVNRATALRDAGWTYIGITPDNITGLTSLDRMAEVIRQLLRYRDKNLLLDTYQQTRYELFMTLFKNYDKPDKEQKKKSRSGKKRQVLRKKRKR